MAVYTDLGFGTQILTGEEQGISWKLIQGVICQPPLLKKKNIHPPYQQEGKDV